jgi:hypothetical protein
MPKPIVEIDGLLVDDLGGFWDEISDKLIPGAAWGRSLDAFNDILGGGFGSPEGGFVLRWLNSSRSRETLGYPETIRWLEVKRQRCHPTNVSHVESELEKARRQEGPTLFDILVEIIDSHRDETTDWGGGPVELELK